MLMLVDGKVYDYYIVRGGCETLGIPLHDTANVTPFESTGQHQLFEKANGSRLRIYAPDAYSPYHLSGSLLDEISEQGGTKNVGFITSEIAGTGVTSCDTQAKYWKTENGRIYKVDDSYYGIMKSNKIGRYFHDNGGHSKFGVPTGDWSDWGAGLGQTQDFQKTTLKMNFVGSIVAEPEAPFYCPGEEPVPEEPIVEETPAPTPEPTAVCGNAKIEEGETCDDGNTIDGDTCSSDCQNECPAGYIPKGGRCMLDFLGGSVHPMAQDSTCGNIDIVYSGTHGDDDYGWRERFGDTHLGIDMRGSTGTSCKINSVADGEVITSGKDQYGANWVRVKHADGFATDYVHGNDIIADTNGSKVTTSSFIFHQGKTGRADGIHLHFNLLLLDKNNLVTEQPDPQSEKYFGYMGRTAKCNYTKPGSPEDTICEGTLYETTKLY